MTALSRFTTSSPFRQALIEEQNLEKALELGRKGSCPDVENGETNIAFAIQWCPHHTKLMETLIMGRDLDVLEFRDAYGNTPMVIAASNANVAAIDLLAKAGAKVCVFGACGCSTLRCAVMDGQFRIEGMFENRAQACAQVLQAARALVRHGVPADDYSIPDGEALVKTYIKKWNLAPVGDPDMVKFLVTEGAAAPSKEEVLEASANPMIAETICAAIEQGLEERRQGVRSAVDAKMPAALITLICDYV